MGRRRIGPSNSLNSTVIGRHDMDEDALQWAVLVVIKELQKREACTSSELAKILRMEESYDLNSLLDLLLEKHLIVRHDDADRKWALPTKSPTRSLPHAIEPDLVTPAPLTLAHETHSPVRRVVVSRNCMPLTSAKDRDLEPFASPPLQGANPLSTGRKQKPTITFPPIPPETSSPSLQAPVVRETQVGPIITFPPIPAETSSPSLPAFDARETPVTPVITFPPIPAETSSPSLPASDAPETPATPTVTLPPILAETSSPSLAVSEAPETPATPTVTLPPILAETSSPSLPASYAPETPATPTVTLAPILAETSSPSLAVSEAPETPATSHVTFLPNSAETSSPFLLASTVSETLGTPQQQQFNADQWGLKFQISTGRGNPHGTGMPVISFTPVPVQSLAPSLPAGVPKSPLTAPQQQKLNADHSEPPVIKFSLIPAESLAPSLPAAVPTSPLTPQQQQQLNVDHRTAPQASTGSGNRNRGAQRTIKKSSKQKSLSELQLRLLKVLKERGPTHTLQLSKAVGLVTCRDVNPSIYDLQARSMVVKVNDIPPEWQLNDSCPNMTFQTDDADQKAHKNESSQEFCNVYV